MSVFRQGLTFRLSIAILLLHPGLSVAGGLSVTVDPPSPQPAGTPVTITVTGNLGKSFDLQMNERSATQAPRVLYDYSKRMDYRWARLDEGWHVIDLLLRDRSAPTVTLLARIPYLLTPLATDAPVVTSTTHPLVAQYSAPPCSAGQYARVRFQASGATKISRTRVRPCRDGRGVNFHVAGMRAATNYDLRHEIIVPGQGVVEVSPASLFLTGSPTVSVVSEVIDPPDASSSVAEQVLVQSATGLDSFPFATDLAGSLVWYFDTAALVSGRYVANRMVNGGGLLMRAPDADGMDDQRLWQTDLVGNVVRETTASRVTEQLNDLGTDSITGFHHESLVLPDGSTALLGYTERLLTDVQGPGTVDVLSDMIVVLDRNWQVKWFWNAFDHLDLSREALLGEVCQNGVPGCPVLILAEEANDWLHSNAIGYSPSDGNLLLSVRHQDWIVKIAYEDGAGDGQVLWRLGRDGDFALDPKAASGDVFPWFSHLHDPNLLPDGGVLLYDNGNTRCELFGVCESRGQVYSLDESGMQATLVENINLGRYSAALGSAQRLANGNYHFNSGAAQPPPDRLGVAQEFLPDGTLSQEQSTVGLIYRSFRVRDLYSAP